MNCYVCMCFMCWFGYSFLTIGSYMYAFVVVGLEGLSRIGVWDVLDGWTHDGHGTG